MNSLKTFGLAAVAAIGLMAALGASSGSATVLCSTTTTPCKLFWHAGTSINTSLDPETTAIWRDTLSFVRDTCSSSSVEGEITNAGGAGSAVVTKVTNLAFSGCTQTTVVNNGATCELEIHSITGSSNGTVTAKGCTVTLVIAGVDCTWGFGNGVHLGTLTEGNPATLDVNAVVQTVDGDSSFCPPTMRWEAKYKVKSPENTTVAVEPEGSASAGVLCSTTTTPCNSKWPLANVSKASLDPENTAIWRDTAGFIKDTCSGSSVEAEITNSGGSSTGVVTRVTNLAFNGCTQTTVVNNGAICELEVHSITGSSNGTVTTRGCTVTAEIGGFDCTWGFSTGVHLGTLTEGNPATLDVNANVVTVDGDSSLCPATMKWEAKYQITSPANTTLAVEPE